MWANYTALLLMDNNNTKNIWIAECCHLRRPDMNIPRLELEELLECIVQYGNERFPPNLHIAIQIMLTIAKLNKFISMIIHRILSEIDRPTILLMNWHDLDMNGMN